MNTGGSARYYWAQQARERTMEARRCDTRADEARHWWTRAWWRFQAHHNRAMAAEFRSVSEH